MLHVLMDSPPRMETAKGTASSPAGRIRRTPQQNWTVSDTD